MKKISAVIGCVVTMLVFAAALWATTYTNFTGSASSLPNMGIGVSGVQATLAFPANTATGDVFQVIGVPSNSTVLAVGYKVIGTNQVSGDVTRSFQIGDGGSAARFLAATSIAAPTAGVLASGTAYMYGTADDTIDVTALGPMTNASVMVWAIIAGPPHL